MSTSLPGHLRPVPDVSRGQPAVPGISRPVRGIAVPISGPGRTGPVPEGLQCRQNIPGNSGSGPRSSGRPAVPGDPGPCLRARGVDQMSQVTSARLRVPAGSTSCPGCLRPGSEGPERSTGCPEGIGPLPKGPCGQPAVPGHSRLGPRGRGVDQLLRVTWAQDHGPAVSTSTPGRIALFSEGLWVRSPVPGNSGLGPRHLVVDELYQETRDLVGGPALSTSLPGRLRPMPEGPRCSPAVPETRTLPEGPGVEQLSRATCACV